MDWALGYIVVGLALLVFGGDLLVRGASRLAAAMRISPLVIGLTVVAFGTSSPELAVSLRSAWAGNADIAVGNVVGSNILNVLLILGMSACIVPLVVSSQLIRWDVPLMIAVSLSMLVFGLDGRIGRAEGTVYVFCLVAYLYWSVRQSRREKSEVKAEFRQEFAHRDLGPARTVSQLVMIVAGLLLLGIGANWLVQGAVTIATMAGVSQLIIGLTIVSAGTSLPEIVTSVLAAYRGERDIAVGNVVGSNLFNILCVLGLSSIISPNGITVSPAAMRFDIPVMVAVALACFPIFFTGNAIVRWEGGLFLFYYCAYTSYLVFDASQSDFSRSIAGVMIVFVIPLTIITLLVTVYRSITGTAETS